MVDVGLGGTAGGAGGTGPYDPVVTPGVQAHASLAQSL
jgi:hypothetical protein